VGINLIPVDPSELQSSLGIPGVGRERRGGAMPSDSISRLEQPREIQGSPLPRRVFFVFAAMMITVPAATLVARGPNEEIDDITGRYEFLGPHDTLAVLEEAGKLKGYIDVFQSEEESDDVLSYGITLGWRKGDRVEIKTATIHRKYYRFTGTVERGKGSKEDDPDYLRLVGEVETVTTKGDSGQADTQKVQVVLKSLGRSEEGEE
jgi:hypothetical protein